MTTSFKDRLSEEEFPPDLTSLITSRGDIRTGADHLSAALHRMMLEVGFRVPGRGDLVVDENHHLVAPNEPFDVAAAGHVFSYVADGGRCKLQVIPIGHNVVVKGIYSDQPVAAFTTTSGLRDYVGNEKAEPVAARYKNLRDLGRRFKNGVALPLMSHAKEAMSLPHGPESVHCLPAELVLMVLGLLDDPRSLLRFGGCCRKFQALANSPGLWRRLFKRHFPRDFESMGESDRAGIDWKEHYRKRKLRDTQRRRSSVQLGRWSRSHERYPPPGMGGRPRGGVPDRFRPRFDPPYPDYH